VSGARLLDAGYSLTLRPMRYPRYYEMYRAAIKNTWTVEEVDFSTDVGDLAAKMTDAERHLVQRLVKMHGGSVEARSGGKDQGTEIIVRLPLSPVGSSRASCCTVRRPRGAQTANSGRPVGHLDYAAGRSTAKGAPERGRYRTRGP